jgi:glycosyltransferase involved in cell wall biosynthesis
MLVNWRALVAFFIYFFRVLNFVRKINPDCIHANVPKSHIILCLLTVFGFRGNGIIHMREIFSKKSIVYLLYHYFFTISRLKVIAISRAVKESLPRNMQRETMVIYNGVFIPPEKESVFVVQPIKFLYLGRIVPWKGCHILLEAFTKLFSQCNKEATLTLTGATIYWDALYRQELFEHINKCNLNKAVVILEATDKPYQVIRNHHVLCMASSLEPFGRVAAEAQSCGLPVIGFSSGGLPEIVVDGKTGYLVPEGDADALTAVMAKFVADPKLISTLGENGRKRAEQLFNRAYQVPKIINYLLKGTVIGN